MRLNTLLLALAWTLTFTLTLSAQGRYTGESFAGRSEVLGANGMVATSQPLATQAALEVLKAGGNAVDAAIAANAMLALVEPTGCGIGGDLFAIVWDAESEQLYGLNGSGRSPQNLTLEWFHEQGMEAIPTFGPLAVSTPGAVDGWFTLHERFGTTSMEDLLAPAIHYARNGYPVTEVIADIWSGYADRLGKYENFRETFLPGGEAPQKGELFKNPDLAGTLEAIASGGRDAFYKGEIARTIARTVQELGGFLAYEDLAAHHAEWVEPVSTNYRGYDVWELPPNGQGIAALQILNILEGYDIAAMGFGSEEYLHTFIEAKKLAYEDRARYYADPDFYQTPVEQLISKAYAAERRALIDPERAARTYDAGELETTNTIYLTVADGEGNMVSLIQSNYSGMGSGVVPEGLGFSLQNRGTFFNIRPEDDDHPNRYAPGKRPFHTIIPGFVTRDGEPYLSFGVMGGGMQPQGHAQVLVNMIDFGMNLQEAGDAPRLRHRGSSSPTGYQMTDGGRVYLEPGFDPDVVMGLVRRGHRIGHALGIYGGYQAILRRPDNGVYVGASESRKDGQAAGY